MNDLNIQYGELCGKCRKRQLDKKKGLILKLLERHSLGVVSKLTGIPKPTLQRFTILRKVNQRKKTEPIPSFKEMGGVDG